ASLLRRQWVFHDIPMRLSEDDAEKIILVRSVEECDKKLFSDQIVLDALAAGKNAEPGLAWVKARAEFLFDHLSPSFQTIRQIARLPSPWTAYLCLLMLVIGFLTNLLGPAEKIHVVRNPVLLLVAWNLLVYLMLALWGITGPSTKRRPAGNDLPENRQPSPPEARRALLPRLAAVLLPGMWSLFHRVAASLQEKAKLAEIAKRFSLNWFAVAPGLVLARWETLLHLGALSLALGAVAGMYFQGLFQGYTAIWTSTFITAEPAVALVVKFIFAPSLWLSQLFGWGLAERIDLARLMSRDGDQAAPWIHLFAISVFIIVVAPRACLAVWQWRLAQRLQRSVGLALDPYFGEVIEAPVRALIEMEVGIAIQSLAADIADFVVQKLYEEQIAPKLRGYRQHGGRITELKAEIQTLSENFLSQLDKYISETRFPEFQEELSRRIGEALKTIGTEFAVFREPQAVLAGLKVSAPGHAEAGIAEQFTRAVSLSIGSSIAIAIATVSGGIGKHLGIAIVSTLLGTTGPVGFLIGLVMGATVAVGAWWVGKQAIAETIETLHLPGTVIKAALWDARFQRLLDEGRQKCEDAVRGSVEAKLQPLGPAITAEILSRVRTLWQSGPR
ncbi:MAG TPA: hypothetical protein VF452_11255, partial [Candidatus Binatia bacterium]